MKRTSAIVVLLVSVGLLSLGLVFLCAAIDQPSRLFLAAALLLAGGGLGAWSGLRLRHLRALDPENLSDRITELARRSNAEVTLSQVVSELGVPDEVAIEALNLLERRGQSQRDRRGDREFYVFPGLIPSKVTRSCPYCGTEYSVKTPVHRCPHCGGDLRLERE